MFATVERIDGIRSAIRHLARQDLRRVDEEQLAGDITELERGIRGLQAERLRRAAELDRRTAARGGGDGATASWLAGALGVSYGAAREEVRMGRALEAMPAARAALGAGEVSPSAVRVLAEARQEHPESFERDEVALVQAARTVPAGELHQVVRSWTEETEPGGSVARAERLRQRRSL